MVCSDCGVALVSELPPEQEAELPEYVEFEEILFTFNAWDSAIIESLLESEDIDHYFQNEFSTVFSHWFNPQG